MRQRIVKRLRELIALTDARATERDASTQPESDNLEQMDDAALHVLYENMLARELTFGTAPIGGRPVNFKTERG